MLERTQLTQNMLFFRNIEGCIFGWELLLKQLTVHFHCFQKKNETIPVAISAGSAMLYKFRKQVSWVTQSPN